MACVCRNGFRSGASIKDLHAELDNQGRWAAIERLGWLR